MRSPRPPYIAADPQDPPPPAPGRLYPACVEPFVGEPCAAAFQVQALDEQVGRGLVARRAFAIGELVFTFTGFRSQVITLHSLTVRADEHVHDPYVMGRVLHACEPNMTCDMNTFTFYALRPIAAGDLCTMDYEQTEATLHRGFQCGCGSPICRGWIGPRV